MSELIVFAVLAGVAVLAWKAQPRRFGLALGFGAVALLMVVRTVEGLLSWASATGWLLAILFVLLVVAVGVGGVWVSWRFPSSRALVGRWGRAIRRKGGVASFLDIVLKASAWAMRRKAATLRPSLRGLTWRERLRHPVTDLAMPLCRSGLLQVWASVEEVVLIFGGPRKGKSGILACRILDAPGAVLVTSTRPDLYENTRALRAERGPVYVFNAVGLAGIDSSITFNPVSGCQDPVVAAGRAEDMLPLGSDSDHAQWVQLARGVLAAMLHAAARGGRSMQDIATWVATPDTYAATVLELLRRAPDTTSTPAPGAAEVLALLRECPDSTEAYAAAATHFFANNEKTRSSITTSIQPALAWLINPHARAAAAGTRPFDVAELLDERATVYLLGGEEGNITALVSALTGYIAREARRIAATKPKGRLDPVLTMVLDECALICRIPLEKWTADMGGYGIHIVAAFQSRQQVVDKWGTSGAGVIVTNAGAIVLFGGVKDDNDLRYWQTLIGQRLEESVTTDRHHRITGRGVREVPVIASPQLAGLPMFRVVVLRGEMLPVIGRALMAWQRRDVIEHERVLKATAAATATPAAPPTATTPAPGATGVDPAPRGPRPAPLSPPVPIRPLPVRPRPHPRPARVADLHEFVPHTTHQEGTRNGNGN